MAVFRPCLQDLICMQEAKSKNGKINMEISKVRLFPLIVIFLMVVVFIPCRGQAILPKITTPAENFKPRIQLFGQAGDKVFYRFGSSVPGLFPNGNSQPFFCHMESVIEKKSKIALRLRLGDLNYVNMLENKK